RLDQDPIQNRHARVARVPHEMPRGELVELGSPARQDDDPADRQREGRGAAAPVGHGAGQLLETIVAGTGRPRLASSWSSRPTARAPAAARSPYTPVSSGIHSTPASRTTTFPHGSSPN